MKMYCDNIIHDSDHLCVCEPVASYVYESYDGSGDFRWVCSLSLSLSLCGLFFAPIYLSACEYALKSSYVYDQVDMQTIYT